MTCYDCGTGNVELKYIDLGRGKHKMICKKCEEAEERKREALHNLFKGAETSPQSDIPSRGFYEKVKHK